MKKSRIIFFERYYPSANMILIKDRSPTLIDTGFGSDVQDTERLIKDAGVSPEELHLIVNTHYHSDHVGGNSYLQDKYGIPIAAHKCEDDLINFSLAEECISECIIHHLAYFHF